MTNTTDAMKQILDAVTDAVRAAGHAGCPEGVLYAHLMGFGCSLSQFHAMIGALVRVGRVRKEGHVLYAV